SAVDSATRCARTGRPRLRPTPTMITALSICGWLSPATGRGRAGTCGTAAGGAGLRTSDRDASDGADRVGTGVGSVSATATGARRPRRADAGPTPTPTATTAAAGAAPD